MWVWGCVCGCDLLVLGFDGVVVDLSFGQRSKHTPIHPIHTPIPLRTAATAGLTPPWPSPRPKTTRGATAPSMEAEARSTSRRSIEEATRRCCLLLSLSLLLLRMAVVVVVVGRCLRVCVMGYGCVCMYGYRHRGCVSREIESTNATINKVPREALLRLRLGEGGHEAVAPDDEDEEECEGSKQGAPHC